MSEKPALSSFAGRRVGVLGMARSGLAVVRALRDAGAVPVLFDDKDAALAPAIELGGRPGTLDEVRDLALLVASPGVPFTHPAPHPVFVAAQAAGVEIVGDVELFVRTHELGPIVAITGTNGKSTTTALIHHLLRAAGLPALLGGNIGKAVFELEPTKADTLVLELSSYQLDLVSTFRPKVAVWLNLTPDHLDRHGSLQGYIAAKRRIFMNMADEDLAVIGIDDAPSADLAAALEEAGRRVVRIAVGREVEGAVCAVDGLILDRTGKARHEVADLAGSSSLRGAHNWQNAAAAYAALRGLGLPPERIEAGFAGFGGLPHRMQQVGQEGAVRFVNDSKATNPESATKSLGSFDEIFWIAGGAPKPGGFAAIDPFLSHVRRAYFIGQAEDEMLAAFKGKVDAVGAGTLERALGQARQDALAAGREAVVLLAPACASFDQFKSYEDRGERFASMVANLTAAEPARETVQ